MYEFTNEQLFAFFNAFLIIIWGISIILFGQISVKHIEREMAKEGSLPPLWDKGVGGRYVMYAMVIVANKAAAASPVDDAAILRHARKKDWYLAMFTGCSFVVLAISSLVYYFYMPAPINP